MRVLFTSRLDGEEAPRCDRGARCGTDADGTDPDVLGVTTTDPRRERRGNKRGNEADNDAGDKPCRKSEDELPDPYIRKPQKNERDAADHGPDKRTGQRQETACE